MTLPLVHRDDSGALPPDQVGQERMAMGVGDGDGGGEGKIHA